MMSVYGKRCLRPECTGRVTFEVGPHPASNKVAAERTFTVLGYTAVQSAQVLRLPL